MKSLVCWYGSTTVTAIQLAVGLIEITMQLATLFFGQLPARTLPGGLRKRVHGPRFTKLPPVTPTAGAESSILYTERCTIESSSQHYGRLHRQHTTQHQNCHQGFHRGHALVHEFRRQFRVTWKSRSLATKTLSHPQR
jgi:hypothetical protein